MNRLPPSPTNRLTCGIRIKPEIRAALKAQIQIEDRPPYQVLESAIKCYIERYIKPYPIRKTGT